MVKKKLDVKPAENLVRCHFINILFPWIFVFYPMNAVIKVEQFL